MRHQGTQQGSTLYKNGNYKKGNKKSPADFSSLLTRYSDQDLINRAFDAIRSTRKSGKVADSVLLAQLQKWERYPAEQVEAGIRTYLEKRYADEGKDENYLWGIIWRIDGEQEAKTTTTQSTGSSLLDRYHEQYG